MQNIEFVLLTGDILRLLPAELLQLLKLVVVLGQQLDQVFCCPLAYLLVCPFVSPLLFLL